jgi:RimJ/RimL family protein N-acetyltransferase
MPYEPTTARLRLRPISQSDAGPTAALMTLGVSRWTATWPTQVSAQDVLQRITDLHVRTARGIYFARAIERLSDGVLMGWTSARKQSPDARVGAIGYWIGEAFHGQGYMTEAVRAFVPLVWENLSVDVIEAGTLPENTASISILKRLGMRYVGDREELAPVRNRIERCVWYALDRSHPDGTVVDSTKGRGISDS